MGMLLASFLIIHFFLKKKRKKQDIISIFLLTILGLFLSAPYLLKTQIIFFETIPPTMPFLLGPFLYFYTCSLTDQCFFWNRLKFLHFIPAIIAYLYFTIVSDFIPGKDLTLILENKSDPFLLPEKILATATLLSLTSYGIQSLYDILKYRYRIYEYFSRISSEIKLKWPMRLIIGYLIIIILLIFLELYQKEFHSLFIYRQKIHTVIALIFVIFFGYLNLNLETVFTESEKQENNDKRYQKSSLPNEKIHKYAHVVNEYFEKEQPYLNPDFSVFDLEKATGISRHHLSQTFSLYYKTSFYMFVNQIRVQEVIEKFKNDKSTSILRIAYLSGFNSKTTFNRVFKLITGFTPSECRNKENISI